MSIKFFLDHIPCLGHFWRKWPKSFVDLKLKKELENLTGVSWFLGWRSYQDSAALQEILQKLSGSTGDSDRAQRLFCVHHARTQRLYRRSYH